MSSLSLSSIVLEISCALLLPSLQNKDNGHQGRAQNINSHDLRRFFSIHGQLADAYVPHIQRRRVHGRFGFIEVTSREQGDRVILEDDGKIFGHQRIRVQWARYPKRSRRTLNARQAMKSREQSWTWRSTHQTKVTKLSDEFDKQNKAAKVFKLDRVNENLEWLEKSLTCISDVPREVEALRTAIQEAFPERILVRDLGKYKFLLTVESQEIKEKLKTEGEECLKQWFSSVSDWAEDDVCQTRRLWLEMVGIPIHIWSEQNIKQIAGKWGDVLYIEKDTSKMASFASAKAVIDTLSMNPIEDEAIIQVENVGYRISVFEAKTEFTIFHLGPVDEDIQPSMEAKCSQREEDEGSSGEVAVQADVAHKDWSKELSHGGTQNDREEQQSHAGKISSNSNSLSVPELRQPRAPPKGSNNSGSHTKTVSFSQNGDTEEAIKSSLQKKALDDGAVYSRLKTIDASTGVLNYLEHALEPKEGDRLPNLVVDKGSNESIEPPPGFEDFGADVLRKKNPRRKQLITERRMTRSQKKLDKSNSQSTTESMRKLAEESIQIGNIVGLKVIANKENAIRRITDSLKEERRRRLSSEQRRK